MVRRRTINDWYLDHGSPSAGDMTDDEAPDRGPDAWLDRAVAGPDRAAASRGIKFGRPARRRGKADVTVKPDAVRHAPKPSTRELDSEISTILRSGADESVQQILHRKGGGWARLTSKDVAVAVRRVQSRIRRTPKPQKKATAAAATRPIERLPSAEEVRRTVLRIHLRHPLWATWEISRYLRDMGWSNVSTDLVRSILPPPGMAIPGTRISTPKRRRGKAGKGRAGSKVSKATQQEAPVGKIESNRSASTAARQLQTRDRWMPSKVDARGVEFCPSCEVRISVNGSCRCS
ncbi:hypothetical protein [Micromonospora auratinigra]|uniref:hypothetical protein n=1 Tax=Micromonospora auratinigra TaxID=261654 RepID=UPI0012FD1CB9|nr:hypothetical protein [Micromonospora auratinigra]